MPESTLKVNKTINRLEWFIQTDLGHRRIRQVPGYNLCTISQGNLYRAVKFLADNPGCQVGIVTGFYVPTANPPAPENDGPPGALFMARGLNQLGYPVLLISDRYCRKPLHQGIELFENQIKDLEFVEFPFEKPQIESFVNSFINNYPRLQCLTSIERIGPCHTMTSFLNDSPKPDKETVEQFNKYGPGDLAGESLNMRGIPVSRYTAPIHLLFEQAKHPPNSMFTIGIGDGGNEIGMGTIPWQVIASNILNGLGGKIACRVKTDTTIVAGVSNWAGYALMAGLYLYLNRVADFLDLYDKSTETKLIEIYYRTKSAVDGKLGCPAMSVDGIEWDLHLRVMEFIQTIVTTIV